jgi:uncharacterized protein (DUF2141 family)
MKTRIPAMLLYISLALSLMHCAEKKADEDPTTIVYETIDEEEPNETNAGKEPSKEKKQGKAKDAKKSNREPLTLVIQNLRSADAPVMVGLYNKKERFLKLEAQLKEYKFIPVGNTLTAQITDREYGEYAIAVYQDENSSGKIDKNFIGIPKEGYCFSNNIKPKTKAPSYKDCKFDYNAKSNTMTMKMIW